MNRKIFITQVVAVLILLTAPLHSMQMESDQKIASARALSSSKDLTLTGEIVSIIKKMTNPAVDKKAKLAFLEQRIQQYDAMVSKMESETKEKYVQQTKPLIDTLTDLRALISRENVINIENYQVKFYLYEHDTFGHGLALILGHNVPPIGKLGSVAYTIELLSYAILWQNPSLVKALKQAGADFTKLDSDPEIDFIGSINYTHNTTHDLAGEFTIDKVSIAVTKDVPPLVQAMKTLNGEIIEAVLEGLEKPTAAKFSKIPLTLTIGQSPLHEVISLFFDDPYMDDIEYMRMIELLLNHGFSINMPAQSECGTETVLDYCVRLGHSSTKNYQGFAHWLTSKGAEMNLTALILRLVMDEQGTFKKPQSEHIERTIRPFITKHGSLVALPIPSNLKIILGIILDCKSYFHPLLLTGNPLAKPLFEKNGIYATHLAAYYRRLDIFKYLAETYSAELLKTADGAVPLHYACAQRDKNFIEYLLSLHTRSVDIGLNATEKRGLTPLDLLHPATKQDLGAPALIDILRSHGAKTGLEIKMAAACETHTLNDKNSKKITSVL